MAHSILDNTTGLDPGDTAHARHYYTMDELKQKWQLGQLESLDSILKQDLSLQCLRSLSERFDLVNHMIKAIQWCVTTMPVAVQAHMNDWLQDVWIAFKSNNHNYDMHNTSYVTDMDEKDCGQDSGQDGEGGGKCLWLFRVELFKCPEHMPRRHRILMHKLGRSRKYLDPRDVAHGVAPFDASNNSAGSDKPWKVLSFHPSLSRPLSDADWVLHPNNCWLKIAEEKTERKQDNTMSLSELYDRSKQVDRYTRLYDMAPKPITFAEFWNAEIIATNFKYDFKRSWALLWNNLVIGDLYEDPYTMVPVPPSKQLSAGWIVSLERNDIRSNHGDIWTQGRVQFSSQVYEAIKSLS